MATLVTPSTTAPTAAGDALLGTYKRAPMELVRGEGVTLWDAEGNAYLDFTAGIAVNALGYGDAGLTRAIQEGAASGVVHASNLFRTGPGEKLASWLVERSRPAKALFCNSGAEANEGGFKFPRRGPRPAAAPP